jgi:hypothetical protein
MTPYTSFLVDEREDVLTEAGRESIASRSELAAPMAMPQTGAKAVTDSELQTNLAESVRSVTAKAPQLSHVANKTFVLRDNIWTDTTYDPDTMRPQHIAFGSAAYFALLSDYADSGQYLAVGDQVILVLSGQAYQIGGGGIRTAQPTPIPAPTPTAIPSEQWSFWRWLRELLR